MSEEETGAAAKVDELTARELTQLRSRLQAAMDQIDLQAKEIADLKLANIKLRERAEAEVKSRLIDDIRKVSNHGIEYLSACSVDRLEQLLEDTKMLKLPRFSSSGDLGSQVDPHEKLHTMLKFGRKE